MTTEQEPQTDPNRLEKLGNQATSVLEKTPCCVIRSSLGLTFLGFIFLYRNPSLNNAIMVTGLSATSLLANFPQQAERLINYLSASDTPTTPPPEDFNATTDHQPPDKI